jgi:hypothetical protein
VVDAALPSSAPVPASDADDTVSSLVEPVQPETSDTVAITMMTSRRTGSFNPVPDPYRAHHPRAPVGAAD